MNNGLRYGMVWALAPRHYNDGLDEPLQRLLSRYASELIRIRNKYRDLLFDGRFNEGFGASVKADANVRYSVFEGMESHGSARACVVMNYGDRAQKAEVAVTGADGRDAEVSAPFEPDRSTKLPAKITIPPHRTAVIVVRH